MFPDLPLERGGSGLEEIPSPTAPPTSIPTPSPRLWFPPAPHSLYGQLPRAGPFLSLWQLLSCLAGVPLPQVQPPEDGTAGREPRVTGNRAFTLGFSHRLQWCECHVWHLFLCSLAQYLVSPKASQASLKTNVCKKEPRILPPLL